MGVAKWSGGSLVDTSELNAHVFALRASGPILRRAVTDVTKLAGQRVRDTARTFVPPSPHLPYYAGSITHDVQAKGNLVEAEIGPDKNRTQGPLGNILEYGTSRHGPPRPHLGQALDLNQDPYEKALLAAMMVTTIGTT